MNIDQGKGRQVCQAAIPFHEKTKALKERSRQINEKALNRRTLDELIDDQRSERRRRQTTDGQDRRKEEE